MYINCVVDHFLLKPLFLEIQKEFCPTDQPVPVKVLIVFLLLQCSRFLFFSLKFDIKVFSTASLSLPK